ncbi:MAG: class I SAM-dependent methyltransferase [Bacteroidetes bacterium]|nr:class I SAM-dependent methyltransferase [Bacteroidota bacterium]
MWYTAVLEKNLIPDFLIRYGIRLNCRQRLRDENVGDLQKQHEKFMAFVEELKQSPVAIETKAANEQHYEVPTKFFQLVLGKNLKYSSGYWKDANVSFDQSEDDMLELTCNRAELKDDHRILECGCGWGSLSLYMAKKFPGSKITGVSNSRTQKLFIDEEAKKRGLANLTIITSDMNVFETNEKFDRIVSVEMFEHMRNYQSLLEKLSSFLYPDGKMFIHIFTHKYLSYFYDVKDESDWMANYFFTGGIMPSDHLLLYFPDHFKIEKHWRVNGQHYQKTSEAWLLNIDRNKSEILEIFSKVYGEENKIKWWVYWRVFFMACAELWGFKKGNEWFVSHYLFQKR